MGYPKLVLLVRRPSGAWDNPYEVTNDRGTRPCVILNEAAGKLRVIYSSVENGGDILYKETCTSSISFGGATTLIKGLYNYAAGSKDNYSPETVILATNVTAPLSLKAVGWLVSDGGTTAQASSRSLAVAGPAAPSKAMVFLSASQNPFYSSTTAQFLLPAGGAYTLTLYNDQGKRQRVLKQGTAEPGDVITAEVDGSLLYGGLYFVRLQAAAAPAKTMRLLLLK